MTRCTEIIVSCAHNELAILGLVLLAAAIGCACGVLAVRAQPRSSKP